MKPMQTKELPLWVVLRVQHGYATPQEIDDIAPSASIGSNQE